MDEEAARKEEEERKIARAKRRRAHDGSRRCSGVLLHTHDPRPTLPRGAALDYSKWDKWLASPDDPATQAEREERARQEEAAKDAAFEEANPDFCSQVKDDIKKRKDGEAVKQRRAQRAWARVGVDFALLLHSLPTLFTPHPPSLPRPEGPGQ